MRDLLTKIYRRDRVLACSGWLLLAALVGMVCLAPFDTRMVAGVNPWIKPMKFGVSIAAYFWTLAWFMGHLGRPRWMLSLIRWGVSTIMVGEFLCICIQAARGTTSHYNVSGVFDAAIWGFMSVGIMLDALLALLVLALFAKRHDQLAPAYLWGVRLGLAVFSLGGLEGLFMVFGASHTVGLADGGPGLPFLDWSTKAGDLRIAHLMGLHALQVFPLVGFGVSRWQTSRTRAFQVATVWGFVGLYVLLTLWQLLRAFDGQPLLRV